ncbi:MULTISPECIES: hypothetical protein [Priestia]|uniref:hypothetical protein n=1 Tax=Priestia TaxID=2800373 RepID=UPI0005EC91F6|nr:MULTISPECIES: hypothetical protein [Priestia]KJL03369.1 hypothetical protein N178_17960 [Priestia aryabhattai B8W22]MBX4160586.1 hypothetical protein [Priestia megaterium]MED3896083.1 hypothetical protein [Priestia aryabhattai]
MIHIKKHYNHDSYKDGPDSSNQSQLQKKDHKDCYIKSNLISDNFKTIKTGTLNVCIIVLPGAKVDRNSKDNQSIVPNRVKRDIAAANRIWKQYEKNRLIQGVTFTITRSFVFLENISGIVSNAENFPIGGASHLTMVQAMLKTGRKICQNADVYVFYMNGNRFGPINFDYSSTLAVTYNSFPLIIMTNASTDEYLLAHELGHFMFITNRFSETDDPEPFHELDRNHNRTPGNLMFPTPEFWPIVPEITGEQIYKALNSRVFYS